MPGEADLDTLNSSINKAETRRVMDKVMPDGAPIGVPGRGRDIRELPGGLEGARDLFDFLSTGGTSYLSGSDVTVFTLPGGAGYVTFRPISGSGDPAIDINFSTGKFLRFHFP
jgi:hypothetical protein